jgi:hypothetical protein
MGTHDIFICFSSKDEATARGVVDFLEARGLKCWISSRDVAPGQNYQEAIVEAIAASKVLVFLFSDFSSESGEIKKELSLAGSRGATVIPLRLCPIKPTGALRYELATRQWIDIFPDRDAALGRVARAATEGLRPRVDGAEAGSTQPALNLVRHPASGLARLRDHLLGGIARISSARVGVAAALLAVTVAAALAFALLPRPWTMAANPMKTAANATKNAPADAAEAVVGAVEIVGAAPRSDNCAGQFCLASAADSPKTNTGPTNPPLHAMEPPAPARETASAAADQAGRTQSPAAGEPVESRVATAYLPFPLLRSGSVDPATVPLPPGAVPTPPGAPSQDRLLSRQDAEDAGAERATDSEPRRRFGRRAHRSRYGRSWSGRRVLRFPF